MPEVFRKNEGQKERLTPWTVVTHASDLIRVVIRTGKEGQYVWETLRISHVASWHGYGFMPRVRFQNGSVHCGTDEAAYNSAVAEGMKLLQEEINENNKGLLEQECLRVRHEGGTPRNVIIYEIRELNVAESV